MGDLNKVVDGTTVGIAARNAARALQQNKVSLARGLARGALKSVALGGPLSMAASVIDPDEAGADSSYTGQNRTPSWEREIKRQQRPALQKRGM